jgi:hypothetical protein
VVEAGGQLKSFALAARMARCLAEVAISDRHLADLVPQVGVELRDARDRRTEDYVHHRRPAPAEAVSEAVAIGVAGGRLLTRVTTASQGPGVHGHGWKEDKVACLHVLKGPTFATDPQPQPPQCVREAPYVDEGVRAFQATHGLPSAEEVAAAADGPAAGRSLSYRGEQFLPEAEVFTDIPMSSGPAATAAAANPAWPPGGAHGPASPAGATARCSSRSWPRRRMRGTSSRPRGVPSWGMGRSTTGQSSRSGSRILNP